MCFVIVKKTCQRCKEARITFILLLSLIGWISNSTISQAALSVSTVNFIIGNSPKFNTEFEQQIRENHFTLLGIKYLGTTYNNDTIQMMPPVDPTQPLNTFISQIEFNIAPLNEQHALDQDGDSNFYADILETSAYVLNNKNKQITLTDTLCELVDQAPFTLVLKADINLSTQYGVPNARLYQVSNSLLIPIKPSVCFLKPNLTFGTEGYAGDINAWNPKHGFIYNQDKVNFPTTGMDGLNYDVKVLGVNVLDEEINRIYSTTANVNLILTPVDSQTVNIKITGPTADNPKTFKANIFNIFIGPLQYQFKLNNWYILKKDSRLAWQNANQWCNQLGGYQLPTVGQLANGTTDIYVHYAQNHYIREVNGGLLGEWGSLREYEEINQWGFAWASNRYNINITSPNIYYYDVKLTDGFKGAPMSTTEQTTICISK